MVARTHALRPHPLEFTLAIESMIDADALAALLSARKRLQPRRARVLIV